MKPARHHPASPTHWPPSVGNSLPSTGPGAFSIPLGAGSAVLRCYHCLTSWLNQRPSHRTVDTDVGHLAFPRHCPRPQRRSAPPSAEKLPISQTRTCRGFEGGAQGHPAVWGGAGFNPVVPQVSKTRWPKITLQSLPDSCPSLHTPRGLAWPHDSSGAPTAQGLQTTPLGRPRPSAAADASLSSGHCQLGPAL